MLRRVFSMSLLCWGLLGCHTNVPHGIDDTLPLPTRVDAISDAQIVALRRKLDEKKIHVINMGDAYMISIPASAVFANESPKIRWNAYQTLDDVICYLEYYRKITVQVNAYASCYQSRTRTQALTVARARAVGNYLWTHDIEARIVFTDGLGNDKPIVAGSTCSDSSPNSRIEIIFKQVVA